MVQVEPWFWVSRSRSPRQSRVSSRRTRTTEYGYDIESLKLSKVRIPHVKFSYFGMLMFMLATLHHKQNCPATEAVSEMRNLNISQEKLGEQGQARGLGGGSRCPYALGLHTRDDPSSCYKKSVPNKSHSFITSEIHSQAIDDWVFKTPGLRALLLNEDEWKTLGEIADVLEVCV
jgi:hypothetical protein